MRDRIESARAETRFATRAKRNEARAGSRSRGGGFSSTMRDERYAKTAPFERRRARSRSSRSFPHHRRSSFSPPTIERARAHIPGCLLQYRLFFAPPEDESFAMTSAAIAPAAARGAPGAHLLELLANPSIGDLSGPDPADFFALSASFSPWRPPWRPPCLLRLLLLLAFFAAAARFASASFAAAIFASFSAFSFSAASFSAAASFAAAASALAFSSASAFAFASPSAAYALALASAFARSTSAACAARSASFAFRASSSGSGGGAAPPPPPRPPSRRRDRGHEPVRLDRVGGELEPAAGLARPSTRPRRRWRARRICARAPRGGAGEAMLAHLDPLLEHRHLVLRGHLERGLG